MRVVSLLPSATELCYALGVEPVGVSHECDYPPPARDLPTIIDSRIDTNATSGEIDDQVQAAVDSGGVYELDREQLAELDPDVVLSQGICEVCAVDDSEARAAVEALDLDAEVVATDPHSLDDLFGDIERIGSLLDREREAATLLTKLQDRVETVRERTPADGPSVVVLDWLDPVMVAGHWVPEMVERVGGTYSLAAPGDRSTPREWETIRESNPDVLVAAPCGFGLDQIADNAGDLTDRKGWVDLRAVADGRVYAMDGHHYVNRPGPRLVDTLEQLAGVLYPECFETAEGVVREFPENRRLQNEPSARDGRPQ